MIMLKMLQAIRERQTAIEKLEESIEQIRLQMLPQSPNYRAVRVQSSPVPVKRTFRL